jgi:hypothetical protein
MGKEKRKQIHILWKKIEEGIYYPEREPREQILSRKVSRKKIILGQKAERADIIRIKGGENKYYLDERGERRCYMKKKGKRIYYLEKEKSKQIPYR